MMDMDIFVLFSYKQRICKIFVESSNKEKSENFLRETLFH